MGDTSNSSLLLRIDTITTSLRNQAQETSSAASEQARQRLLATARSLISQIETPTERIGRMIWHDPLVFAATRILIDLKAFENIATAKGPVTADQLAERSNADPRLVERLLKQVATEGYVREVAADTYSASPITHMLATGPGQGGVKDMFNCVKSYAELPAYLRETGYANPTDKDNSPFKYAYKTDKHYFDWIGEDAQRVVALQGHMTFKNSGLQWYEEPEIIRSALGDGVNKEEVLIVDMGGSSGHQLTGFRKAHPSMTGRLVLQDLQSTIDELDKDALLSQGVEATAHDFFTDQPVQGAKAYYFKMVLHDWPNESCISILKHLRPALKKVHSKILLNEIVVPEVGAGWYETSVDLLMMSVHAAQERREREWRSLIDAVGGLKINRIWDVHGAVEKVIEIEIV